MNKKMDEVYFEYYYVDKILSGASLEDNFFVDDLPFIISYEYYEKRHRLDKLKKEYDKIKEWYYDALKFDLGYLKVLSSEDPTNIAFIMAIKKKEENTPDDEIFMEVVKRLKKNKRID